MYKGVKPPNDALLTFTRTPNEFHSVIRRRVKTLAELQVIETIIRKTYGWVDGKGSRIYKEEDAISISQFVEESGMTGQAVIRGLREAIAHGHVIRVRQGSPGSMQSAVYRLRYDTDPEFDEDRDDPSADEVTEQLPNIPNIPSDLLSAQYYPTISTILAPTISTILTKENDKETNQKKICLSTPSEEAVASAQQPEVILSDVSEDSGKRSLPDREVFSTADVKETPYQRFMGKAQKDYNAQDLAFYFSKVFRITYKVPYSSISIKDKSLLKTLSGTHGPVKVCQAIDYLMSHKDKYVRGAPSISVLYGWRVSIFTDMEVPDTPVVDVRQSNFTPDKKGKEVVSWD